MAHTLWVAGSGFVGGVFIASLLSVPYLALLCVFLACAVLYVPRGLLVSLFLFSAALGMFRVQVVSIPESVALSASVGETVSLEGDVFEEPDIRERSTRLSVKLYGDVGVLIIAPLHVDVAYGDRVRATGVVRLPETFDTGLGASFNYPAFLAKDGIRYELAFARVERVGDGEWNWFKGAAIVIKQKYIEGIARALPEPHAGLAGGITAGDKRGLGKELMETFTLVGLIHIVVLSGYNIMVVIGFIERVFARAHRHLRLSMNIGVATLFACMTGLASSSVRAAAMASIASVGKTLGRTYLAARALLLVAVCMVLWNPLLLAFDPGFQLSIIATWGLLFVSPILTPYLSFITERFQLRDIVAATIGTQLSVLPLLLFHGGQFSLMSLPANVLVLAVVPYAMLASFVAGIGGLVAGPLAFLIAFPAFALLSYILFIVEWSAKVPFAAVSIVGFSFIAVVLSYVMLATGVLLQQKTRGQ